MLSSLVSAGSQKEEDAEEPAPGSSLGGLFRTKTQKMAPASQEEDDEGKAGISGLLGGAVASGGHLGKVKAAAVLGANAVMSPEGLITAAGAEAKKSVSAASSGLRQAGRAMSYESPEGDSPRGDARDGDGRDPVRDSARSSVRDSDEEKEEEQQEDADEGGLKRVSTAEENSRRDAEAARREYFANQQARKAKESHVDENSQEFKEKKELAKLSAKLEAMRVATMLDMVRTVTLTVGDQKAPCRYMYLTNTQISNLKTFSFKKMREELQLGNPRMVIRIVQSKFGYSYWPAFPFWAGRYPLKKLPEVTLLDADATDHKLLLLAKEILALARKTSALVIGNELCSLTAAFVRVAFPEQKERGNKCPFQVLIFAKLPTLDFKANINSSVVSSIKEDSNAWKECNISAALEARFGEDPAWWPQEDLPCGVYGLVLFECLDKDLVTGIPKLMESGANMFQNSFIASLVEIPVIGIQTYGCNQLELLSLMADHVRRNYPLLLIDSRSRQEEQATTVEDAKKVLAEFSEQLHKSNSMDLYSTSMIAYVKAAFNIWLNAGDQGDSVQKQRSMWIWEAIKSMQRRPKRKGEKDKSLEAQRDRDDEIQEQLLFGADTVLRNAGREIQWEMEKRHERFREGIANIQKATTWEELRKLLDDNWLAMRGCLFHNYKSLKEFIENHAWLNLKNHGRNTMNGRYQLVVNMSSVSDVVRSGMTVERAKSALVAYLEGEHFKAEARDKAFLTEQALASQEKKWLDIIEVLQANHVQASSLHDLQGCTRMLSDMAQIDYLPTFSSLECLVLIRRAWSLRDVYDSHARYYKKIAKAVYAMYLITGTTTITLTTLRTLSRHPYNLGKFMSDDQVGVTILALSLFASFLTAITTLVEPTRKWFGLRGGSLMLESELWKFRARMGKYAKDSAVGAIAKDVAEREAEAAFGQTLMDIQQRVQQTATGMKRTSFFANTTTSADAMKELKAGDMEDEGTSLWKSSPVLGGEKHKKKVDKKSAVNKAYIKHGQYEVVPFVRDGCQSGTDNHHTPVSAEEYIKWRLVPLRDFYQGKIPAYARRRSIFQALLLIFSIGNALIAGWDAVGLPWTSIVASLAATIAAWQEFTGIEHKLDRYSSVASALENVLTWWQALSDVDKAVMESVQRLVLDTEAMVSSEHAAWMSDAEQVAGKMKQDKEKTQKQKGQKGSQNELAGHHAHDEEDEEGNCPTCGQPVH